MRKPFLLLWCLVASSTFASTTKDAMRVLRDECIACHRPGKAKGGLLLHDPEKMMAGGDSGSALVLGKPEESYLIEVLHEDGDPHMPPKKQLTDTQIATLSAWVKEGAKWDASVFDEAPAPQPIAVAPLPPNYTPILGLLHSPDGKQLAVSRGSEMLILNAADPKLPVLQRVQVPVAPISAMTWSVDSKVLYLGTVQRLYQWNLDQPAKVELLTEGLLGTIQAMVADKQGFLWFSDGATGGAGFVRKMQLKDRKMVSTFKGHEDLIYSMSISPDGRHLLTASADKYVKRWDLKTQKVTSVYEGHTNHVLRATFNEDGTKLATASADREIKLWNSETRLQEAVLGNKKFAYADLDWSRDGKIIATITDHGAGDVYYDFVAHTGAQSSRAASTRRLVPVKESLAICALSPDGKFLYAGAYSGSLHVWNTTTGGVVQSLPLK